MKSRYHIPETNDVIVIIFLWFRYLLQAYFGDCSLTTMTCFQVQKPVYGSGGGMLCQKYWKYWGDLSIISGKYWRALSIISGRLALALVGMRQCRLLCSWGEKIPSLYWNFSRLRIQNLFQGGMHVAKSWEEKYSQKTFTSTHPTLSVAV